MDNNKKRYGNLLDNVMKKQDDKMVNAAEKFVDSIASNKQQK